MPACLILSDRTSVYEEQGQLSCPKSCIQQVYTPTMSNTMLSLLSMDEILVDKAKLQDEGKALEYIVTFVSFLSTVTVNLFLCSRHAIIPVYSSQSEAVSMPSLYFNTLYSAEDDIQRNIII